MKSVSEIEREIDWWTEELRISKEKVLKAERELRLYKEDIIKAKALEEKKEREEEAKKHSGEATATAH